MSAALSPASRAAAIEALSTTPLDVLVVGGGIVGAGTALDAVTRGLSTGLVEQRDLASGTSSRSSKLIHGGLRYLEMLDFALVHEALQERGLLVNTLAPHLVHPVSFLYPLTHRGWERPYVGSGLLLYDALAAIGRYGRGLPRHHHLSRRGVKKLAPGLKVDELAGAIRYWDAQVDDARLVMTVARTAATFGAHVATRTQVTGFLRDGDRVVGVTATDLETGRSFEIRARAVVNAAGVWTNQLQQLMGGRGALNVQASKGVHLVVPRDRIRSGTGIIVRTEVSVLFVIPWDRHWVIGTTDTPWQLDLAHPAASRTDIDYLLRHVNPILERPLTHDDIQGVYAGLRPLASGKSEPTSRISREHTVVTPVPGLVMIAGGKLTTYRVMGKDAIDATADTLGPLPDSITSRVPLAGADGYAARSGQLRPLAKRTGLPQERVTRLLSRYGGLVDELFGLIEERPDLREPLKGAQGYLRAEAVYAVTHEGARHLDDVLTRRTRISIETFDRGVTCAREVAELMAAELGWDASRVADEVEHYLLRVKAERDSQAQLTDPEADEARVRAPDII